jgi:hypothetical protein
MLSCILRSRYSISSSLRKHAAAQLLACDLQCTRNGINDPTPINRLSQVERLDASVSRKPPLRYCTTAASGSKEYLYCARPLDFFLRVPLQSCKAPKVYRATGTSALKDTPLLSPATHPPASRLGNTQRSKASLEPCPTAPSC